MNKEELLGVSGIAYRHIKLPDMFYDYATRKYTSFSPSFQKTPKCFVGKVKLLRYYSRWIIDRADQPYPISLLSFTYQLSPYRSKSLSSCSSSSDLIKRQIKSLLM